MKSRREAASQEQQRLARNRNGNAMKWHLKGNQKQQQQRQQQYGAAAAEASAAAAAANNLIQVLSLCRVP